MPAEPPAGTPAVEPPPAPPAAPGFRFSVPELPEPVTPATGPAADHGEPPAEPLRREPMAVPATVLRAGCHLLRFTPTPHATAVSPLHYDGTLRVERTRTRITASGDLYVHRPRPFAFPGAPPAREPDPGAGIPVLPRRDYRFYVRVTRITELPRSAGAVTLGFELHRHRARTGAWSLQGAYTAHLRRSAAPAGFPSPQDHLRGEVTDAGGAVVGELTAGWISEKLRRAVIEVDRVPGAEPALANAAGLGWAELFEQVGWEVTVDESDADLPEPSGRSWSDAEMHQALLARRESADLDAEWRYWLVCVRRLDATERGIMFDNGATDSNAVPREGAGIAADWVIPDEPAWGLVRGLRFGAATDPYFRTAVHELGHAMGLYHNHVDAGFMNTTPEIAAAASPQLPFPRNIRWAHAPGDARRLRHMPDVWVRPGGTEFGAPYSSAPISAGDDVAEADGLRVEVLPVLEAVPIGAPVRVEVRLVNDSGVPLPAPASVGLKAGSASGRVTDPSGAVRTFRPLLRCIEDHPVAELADGAVVADSLTLLRGPEGALFPAAGVHRVEVDVDWTVDGRPVRATGEASVMVTGAAGASHAAGALRVLDTPDALLTLAIGGDHLHEGIAAVQAALEDETLRPHFAWIEAKRVARGFHDRPADLDRAAGLMEDGAVLSAAEDRKAHDLLAGPGSPAPPPPKEDP